MADDDDDDDHPAEHTLARRSVGQEEEEEEEGSSHPLPPPPSSPYIRHCERGKPAVQHEKGARTDPKKKKEEEEETQKGRFFAHDRPDLRLSGQETRPKTMIPSGTFFDGDGKREKKNDSRRTTTPHRTTVGKGKAKKEDSHNEHLFPLCPLPFRVPVCTAFPLWTSRRPRRIVLAVVFLHPHRLRRTPHDDPPRYDRHRSFTSPPPLVGPTLPKKNRRRSVDGNALVQGVSRAAPLPPLDGMTIPIPSRAIRRIHGATDPPPPAPPPCS